MTPKLKAKRYTTSELVHFRNYERIKNIDMGIRVGSSSIQMVAKSCWRQGEREARARVKEDSRRQKLQAKDRNSKTSLKKEDFRQGGDGLQGARSVTPTVTKNNAEERICQTPLSGYSGETLSSSGMAQDLIGVNGTWKSTTD